MQTIRTQQNEIKRLREALKAMVQGEENDIEMEDTNDKEETEETMSTSEHDVDSDDESDDGSEEGLSVDDESVEWAAPLGEVLARDNFRPLKRVVIGVYAPPTDEVGAKYDIAAVAEDLKTYFQVWDDRGIFFVELSQDILCLEALTCMTNAF